MRSDGCVRVCPSSKLAWDCQVDATTKIFACGRGVITHCHGLTPPLDVQFLAGELFVVFSSHDRHGHPFMFGAFIFESNFPVSGSWCFCPERCESKVTMQDRFCWNHPHIPPPHKTTCKNKRTPDDQKGSGVSDFSLRSSCQEMYILPLRRIVKPAMTQKVVNSFAFSAAPALFSGTFVNEAREIRRVLRLFVPPLTQSSPT